MEHMANHPENFAPLRAFRLKRHMSQQDLAAASGVSLRTIKYAEARTRLLKDLSRYKLADALGVSPEELLDPEAALGDVA